MRKTEIDGIDGKIANIRDAVENGLSDAEWANERLTELNTERDRLLQSTRLTGPPPKVDIREAAAYRRKLDDVMLSSKQYDKKKFLKHWIRDIKLAPEDLSVTICYRIPEPVVNTLVAGGGFEPPTFGL